MAIKTEPHWEDYPNFSRSEFACQHCGRAEMDEDFMWRLQDLREAYGKPMRVTSGYRCPQHPIESGKKSLGAHTTGRAVDIGVTRGDAYSLLRLAIRMGFTGIGVQQKGEGRFLHLDDITAKEDFDGKKFPRPTIWSY